MLRFIDISGQITEGDIEFAFFDTVTDRFIEYGGIQVFDDWGDFLFWRDGEENKYPQHSLARFWSITSDSIRPVHYRMEQARKSPKGRRGTR